MDDMGPPRPGVNVGRDSIDLAQGILMERYHLGSRAASAMLRAHADARRLPVSEIAHWLVATRLLL
ncbi:ANTAR domain-containing protein [Kribbella sp. NPDC000426]|uniref:ANTAR domain-containing protein n=1 Tax=Kribbella sp. NPDC000426 TaxID=3154255 RepID=UPI00332FC4F4